MDIILSRNDTEILTAEQYLKLTAEEKSKIVASQIIPPALGKENDFGNIQVTYSTPIYR